MKIFVKRMKPTLAVCGLIALSPIASVADSVTFNMTAATLADGSGSPMPTTGLAILVASTTNSTFGVPTAAGFVSGDDIEIARWNLSAQSTAGQLVEGTSPIEFAGNWGAGDPVALYWFPTLNIGSAAPTNGTPYGFYRDAVGIDGSDVWVTPPAGQPGNLVFLTIDTSLGTSPNNAGYASLTVAAGNTAPVANADGPFFRAPSLSVKIPIATLLANDTDAETNTITFTGIPGNSTNNAVISTNSIYVFYPANTNNVADRFSYTIRDSVGAVSTGLVYIAISPSVVGQAVSITNASGSYIATFAGIPTYSYTVQRATNVNFSGTVTDLVTTNAPAAGLFRWTDSTPPTPTAFYRLRYNSP